MEEAKTAKRGSPPKQAAVKCFVPTCDSKMGSVSRRNNVSFYSFPKKQTSLYARWKRAVRGSEPPGDGSKVCSLHFKEEDYKCQALRKLRVFLLNENAVPSLRLPSAWPREPSRLTRSSARLATGDREPTNPAVTAVKVEDSCEETIANGLVNLSEAAALKEEEQDEDPRETPPPKKINARTCDRVTPPARGRKQRRNHHFSSNKLKNRLKRAERCGKRAVVETTNNNNKKSFTEKIRDFRESLVGGRRSFKINQGGEVVREETSDPVDVEPPPKRFVALKMDVAPAPTPSRTKPPPAKPFVALKMGISPSLSKHCIKQPPTKSYVLCRSDGRARLAEKVKHKVHTVKGQTCCVPGCTTSQHQLGGGTSHPVFSFPTDPRWKARWNKSIFGDSNKTHGATNASHRTVASNADGSKIFVHRSKIKMPMAAYRALFSIPGWGRSKGAGTGDATLVIDERRLGGGGSMVCSAHFLDGKPTAKNPIPRLNLRPNAQELEGVEVRPVVHADHTYAVNTSPGLPTPPKQPADMLPESPPLQVQSRPPTPPADTPGDDTVARRKGGNKTDRCPARRRSAEHRDHTYAVISELNDLDRSDHTYAFIIQEVRNTDATIWGQYSVSPLAQACYTNTTGSDTFTENQDLVYAVTKHPQSTVLERGLRNTTGMETFTEDQDLVYGVSKHPQSTVLERGLGNKTGMETFTEDQDLFYATVKQEVEDEFDTSPLGGDRCFSSDWDQLPAIKQEPVDADVDVLTVDRIKTEPTSEPECGSFQFVDVSNFMNDYQADFEDLGSLDSVCPAK